jgi:hypothetical protein
VMVGVSACGKASVEAVRADAGESAAAASGAGAGGSASANAGGSASASAGVRADSGASASAGARAWRGPYKSVESVITLPADVKWRVPESTAGIGDGTLALTADPAGRVNGIIDGVLGPALVVGLLADGRLTGSVLRKDPSDHGFTGTLAADLGDADARGTLHVTLAEASAVRQATFELSPEAAR